MENVKLFAKNLDQATVDQIKDISQSPIFKNEKIAIMADAHAGKGACVGFTSTFTNQIIPNIVGVDIGCGMAMTELNNNFDSIIHYDSLQLAIENTVMKNHYENTEAISSRYPSLYQTMKSRLEDISFPVTIKKHLEQLGTLGGGNHFIEIVKQEDNNKKKYIVVHSGSRNLGALVAEHHQKIAEQNFKVIETPKELLATIPNDQKAQWIKDWKETNRPIKGLEYLTVEQTKVYLSDMKIVQLYAEINRFLILANIFLEYEITTNTKINNNSSDLISCVHNYIDLDNNIIRKGAIKGLGKVIIPLNMRDGIIFGDGEATKEMNYSLPHGAGRQLSRTKAKENITMEKFRDDMKDVVSFSVNEETLDEAPDAYKDKNYILEMVSPYIKNMKRLIPIFNSKNFYKVGA